LWQSTVYEDFVILTCTAQGCDRQTDRRTNGQTDTSKMAKTREVLHAVARKNRIQRACGLILSYIDMHFIQCVFKQIICLFCLGRCW